MIVKKRIDTKAVVKVVLCLMMYAFFGCVISDEDELLTKRTNQFPSLLVEYGDYIFGCAFFIWLSVHCKVDIQTYCRLKFLVELFSCVILTNIAFKVIYTQLIELSFILCTLTADLLSELYKYLAFDFIKSAADLLKTENCGRLILTCFSLLVLSYVIESVSGIGYVLCLINKHYCPPCPIPEDRSPCSSLRIPRRGSLKVLPKRRRRFSRRMCESDNEDNSQYIEPVNGPILSQ